MWAEHHGRSSNSGNGLRVIDVEEARVHMEAAYCPEHVYESFGLPLLEG